MICELLNSRIGRLAMFWHIIGAIAAGPGAIIGTFFGIIVGIIIFLRSRPADRN